MLDLSWNDLVMRVANKVGITQPTPLQQNTILYNLMDALAEIRATAQDIKVLDKKYAVFDGVKPDTIPSAVVSSGNGSSQLTSGVYRYAYCFYNELQGETELVDFSSSVQLDDSSTQQITITGLPNIPHGVSGIVIYRTKVDGTVFYKHSVRTSSASFVDNVPDSSLIEIYEELEHYADTSDISLPNNLFVLTQLKFTDIEDKQLLAKEATSEEEFVRVKKEIVGQTESSTSVGSEPVVLTSGTFEETLYSGSIIYTLRNTYPKTINYKPRFNGYIYLTYTEVPDVNLTDLEAKPEVAYLFRQLLVKHATLSYLFNILSQVPIEERLTEAQIQSLIILYRVESSNYEKMLKRYVGYTKQRVAPYQTRLPDFINDIKMELLP